MRFAGLCHGEHRKDTFCKIGCGCLVAFSSAGQARILGLEAVVLAQTR
jgi:hypothetical protein